MALAYLLDTNVISEPLRPVPNKKVLAKLRRYQDRIALPSPVWHELLFGVQRLPLSSKRQLIERYLFEVVEPTMPILPYEEQLLVGMRKSEQD